MKKQKSPTEIIFLDRLTTLTIGHSLVSLAMTTINLRVEAEFG